ncbi:ras-related protein Rab-26-like [Physella acuta]|uniref:ras-related protein Rab-26-like n=1 Tax=Physella acuta TaxID=109671 RepID=UPI0027DBE480|nr:ras-related protein Rab-26-like [Physella acuta]
MNAMERFPKNRMKVTILGDSRVGKTCLMLRYLYDSFDIDPRILYIEFRNKTVDVSGVKVMLQILDTDSNKRFRPRITSSLRNFAGIIIVFDLTSKSSFDTVQYWLQQVHEHAGENVDIVLVGNKVDLAESRVIDHETASSLAQTFGAMYVECSVKTRYNVNLVFNSLASKWAKHVPVQQEEPLRLESETFYQVPCYGKDTCSLF